MRTDDLAPPRARSHHPTSNDTTPGWSQHRVTVLSVPVPVWLIAVIVAAVLTTAAVIWATGRPAPSVAANVSGDNAAVYLTSTDPATFTTLASTRATQPAHPDAFTQAVSTLMTDTQTAPPIPDAINVSTLAPPYALIAYTSTDTATPVTPVFVARGQLTDPLPAGWYTATDGDVTVLGANETAVTAAATPTTYTLADIVEPAAAAAPSGRNGLLWVDPIEATKVTPAIIPWLGRDTAAAAVFLGPGADEPAAAAVFTDDAVVTITTPTPAGTTVDVDTLPPMPDPLLPVNTTIGYVTTGRDTADPIQAAWRSLGMTDDERRALSRDGFTWAVTVERDGVGVVAESHTTDPVLVSTILTPSTQDTLSTLLPESTRAVPAVTDLTFTQQPFSNGLLTTTRPDRLTPAGAGFTDRPDVNLPDLTGATSLSFTNIALTDAAVQRAPSPVAPTPAPDIPPPAVAWVTYADGHHVGVYTPTATVDDLVNALTLPPTWFDSTDAITAPVATAANTDGPIITISDLPQPVPFTDAPSTRTLMNGYADQITGMWKATKESLSEDDAAAVDATITATVTELRSATPGAAATWSELMHNRYQHGALNTLAQIQTVALAPTATAWADTSRWQAVIDNPDSTDEQRDAAQTLVEHGPQASQWMLTWIQNITGQSAFDPHAVATDIDIVNTTDEHHLHDVTEAYRIAEGATTA